MPQQEKLLNVDSRYKTAFEQARRENHALQEKVNLQSYTIKRLRREVNKNESLRNKIKKFFGIKPKKKTTEIVERPLRKKENQKKLIAMLENGLSIKQIEIETGWKRENVRDFIRVHSLRSLIKRK